MPQTIPIKEAYRIIDASRHPAGFTQRTFAISYHTLEKGGESKVVHIKRACKGLYIVYDPKTHGNQDELAKAKKPKAAQDGQPTTPTPKGAPRDQIKIWDLDYQNKDRKSGWHTIYYDQIRAINGQLVIRPMDEEEAN